MQSLLSNELSLKIDDFVELLGHANGIISGSFSLQCIQGVQQTFDVQSDIGIYVKCPEEGEFCSPMNETVAFLKRNLYRVVYRTDFEGYQPMRRYGEQNPRYWGYGELCTIYLK